MLILTDFVDSWELTHPTKEGEEVNFYNSGFTFSRVDETLAKRIDFILYRGTAKTNSYSV